MLRCEICQFFESDNLLSLSTHQSHCASWVKANPGSRSRWYCKLCDQYFFTKLIQRAHNKEKGHKPAHFIDQEVLRSERECSFCGQTWEANRTSLVNHETQCALNPDRKVKPRRPHTDEEKAHLAKIMRARHAAGLAAKWQNPTLKESWPEKFFASVIDNDFDDKQVTRELPMGKYWLDFAWPHKMKTIEIDGGQHERAHQKASDRRKDALANELGWDLMRIKWEDLYRNTKVWIDNANVFIGV